MTDITQCNGTCWVAQRCVCANDNYRMDLYGQQSLKVCKLCSSIFDILDEKTPKADSEYTAAYEGRIYWSTKCVNSNCVLVDCPKCSEKSPEFMIAQHGACITCRVRNSTHISCTVKRLSHRCSDATCTHELYETDCPHYLTKIVKMDYCNHLVCSECTIAHIIANPTALLCYTCNTILL